MENPAQYDDVKVTDAPEQPDFSLLNEGSIFVLFAQTEAAEQWVTDHLPGDVMTWGRNGYVVEWRFIEDIVFGIENDGLTVQNLRS
jgi:hypothetical protein